HLERRERGVGADESNRDEIPPIRMREAPGQEHHHDAHQETAAHVDGKRSPGEQSGNARLNSGGELVSSKRAERASERDHHVAVQSASSCYQIYRAAAGANRLYNRGVSPEMAGVKAIVATAVFNTSA